ncbi:hypothetical protein (plasmid) [Citrobacter freundii]|jgi:hypothetical protein|uniref:Uncharacterized protein n=2 Tax=Enterobacteriaceae TaxID=543 RepID=A0A345WYN0_KLEPN|nr:MULTISPECIES: hypothetical protein [Enterobacteriaceae]ASP02818.1 hypothetical protein MS7884_pA0037 [Enterobacter hormaechei]AXJ98435.1 hypothetical protein [Klebsiella oxytoca]EJU27705.1 hypothetical protein HMPREF1144_3034 [Klebsiella sp. OBRC7]EPY94135.1 hypothetical protein L799_23045 [Enterobacter roggenkampii EC_38VIM1]ERO94367.1 hypothetical protein L454_05153 [Escherichia coli BIDMC 19C]ETX96224.1 hypothetical protein L453_09386 [Escherichia coli BIDMC 19B]ETY06227.1 hypothetical
MPFSDFLKIIQKFQCATVLEKVLMLLFVILIIVQQVIDTFCSR